MKVVILAGGVGKRLWPLGRQNNPKQFFPVVTKKPLVLETYERLAEDFKREDIYFSVTNSLLPFIKKLFPRLPDKQFIVEPARRDTAPAMGYASAVLFLEKPDEPIVFVPSDHFIADNKKFLRCLRAGGELVIKTRKLLDIGVKAAFPSTVLGYTKICASYVTVNGVEVFNFAGHTEKPNLATAKKYFASGKYLWHGNYYMWTPRLFLDALNFYAPKLGHGLKKIIKLLPKGDLKAIKDIYEQFEQISFDYAVTEKINKRNVLIIKGDFGWGDVGAWDVLHSQLKHAADVDGNVTRGRVATVEAKNCLLYSHQEKLLAVLGMDDIVVVDTEDALLVCPRSRSQEVKKILEEVERRGWKNYL